MIGTSTAAYISIRSIIFLLHWIAPLSICYCLVAFILQIPHYRTFWLLEAYIVAETVFHFLVYLPRKRYLQAPATHPSTLSRKERHQLFRRCHENVPHPRNYLSKWFLDAPLSEIKRDNVQDFLRWAFLNKQEPDPAEEEELEGYLDELQEMLGFRLEPGRGNAKFLGLTIDPVDMLHRSITWYLVSTDACMSMRD